MTVPLNFQTVREDGSASWRRGHPDHVDDVATLSLNRWRIRLDGGSPHVVRLERERGAYSGACDCEWFQTYRDDESRPCAHLCAIRRATWEHEHGWEPVTDDTGQPVRVVDVTQERADQRVEEIVADGGQRR